MSDLVVRQIRKLTTKTRLSWAVLILAGVLTGCDNDDSDDDDVLVTTSFLQVANAIPDSPPLTINVDTDLDDVETTLDIVSVESFQTVSRRRSIATGDITFEVTDPNSPTGDTVTLIAETGISIVADTIYTVLLTGTYANPGFMVLANPIGDIEDDESGEVELQVVNLGTSDPLDIFFNLTSDYTPPVATVSAGNASGTFRLAADDYFFSVGDQVSGETTFDAGAVNFLSQSRRTIVVTEQAPGGTEIFMITNTGTTLSFGNESAAPQLRIVNAVPDELTLNIELVDSFSSSEQQTLALGYGQASDYFAIDLASVFLDVTVAASDLPDVELFSNIISLDGDMFYTLVIGGSVDSEITTKISSQDERQQATVANIMLLNASDITVLDDDGLEVELALNFYILEVGQSIDDSSPVASLLGSLDTASTTFSAVPVVVVVTEGSSNNIVAGPDPLLIEAKSSILIMATEAAGGGLPLSLSVQVE